MSKRATIRAWFSQRPSMIRVAPVPAVRSTSDGHVSHPSPPSVPTRPDPREPAWELMNEELKGRLARVYDSLGRIDTKSALLVGFVAPSLPLVIANRPYWQIAWIAFIAYAVTFIFGVLALRLRRHPDVPDTDYLLAKFSDAPKIRILQVLVWTRHEAIRQNMMLSKRKARFWRIGITSLGIAIFFSAASLIAERVIK